MSFKLVSFYRAMHFSAKRGLAIACRLSVCPSVRPSVTLVDCDHLGWNSSEIISPLVSPGCLLSADPNNRGLLQGNTRKVWPKVTHHSLWCDARWTWYGKLWNLSGVPTWPAGVGYVTGYGQFGTWPFRYIPLRYRFFAKFEIWTTSVHVLLRYM